jgi:SAM-dependent methyltransferase
MPSSESDEDLLDASLFINLETRTECFSFGRWSLSLEVSTSACTDHDLTGQLAWPGAQVMCHWLSEQPEAFFVGAAALGLGSGTGLAELMFGARGGCVTVTDYQPVVLDLLERNVQACRAADPSFGDVRCAKLLWADAADEDALLACSPNGKGYPLLLGADIVYPGSQRHLPSLLWSVCRLLAPGGAFYLCYCSRVLSTDVALFEALASAQLRSCAVSEPRSVGGVSGTVYRIERCAAT